MLTKVAQILRAAPRLQPIGRSSHGVPSHWKTPMQICKETKAHMDFLPVPEGSWQEAHSKRSANQNMVLGGSILFFIVTAGAMWMSGTMYLHRAPPMYNCKKPSS
ncbi:hypothetical protein BsWGS_17866 [Bradybaena similaris]